MLIEWIVSRLSLRQVGRIVISPPEELRPLSPVTWKTLPILVKASGLYPSLQVSLPLSSAEQRTTGCHRVPWEFFRNSAKSFWTCVSHSGIHTSWHFKLAHLSPLRKTWTRLRLRLGLTLAHACLLPVRRSVSIRPVRSQTACTSSQFCLKMRT